MSENVDHPAHYGGADNPHEAIKVIEAWGLGFHLGNALKYIARAGKKGDTVEDLEKARWYIDRKIACLSAEVEAETVPTPAPAVEPSASELAAGTPVWEHQGGVDWRAHSGPMTALMYTMYANDAWWTRYPDSGEGTHIDNGVGPTLAANIRAASASWNAAHPDLPPVIVPEQFREGPQVEPPEEVGDGEQTPCWCYDCKTDEERVTSWTSCPDCHNKRCPKATHHSHACTGSNEPGQPGSRYAAKPPQTPAERVAAMTDEEVEAFVTGEGVGPWVECAGAHWERCWGKVDEDEAISSYGTCWRRPDPVPENLDWRYDHQTGDTTTPAGRMECTRRLAVHLLREKEGSNG